MRSLLTRCHVTLKLHWISSKPLLVRGDLVIVFCFVQNNIFVVLGVEKEEGDKLL